MDWCICFTRKIQHGGDWEWEWPQGPKNVHNFLMTVWPLSFACGHGTETLLILKKNYFWPDYFPIFCDMTAQRNVPRFCTLSICGWNLFQPPGLGFFCFWVNTPAALHYGVSGLRGWGKRLADLVDQLTLECCHSFRFYGSCRKIIPIRDSSMPKRILSQCGVGSDVFIGLIVPTTCSSICWD